MSTELHCVHCGFAMVRSGTRDKWKCHSCLGVLLGRLELEVELGELGPLVVHEAIEVAANGEAPRTCPICDGGMELFVLGPLVLDRCPTDRAVWFDNSELGRMRRAFHTSDEADWVRRLRARVFS